MLPSASVADGTHRPVHLGVPGLGAGFGGLLGLQHLSLAGGRLGGGLRRGVARLRHGPARRGDGATGRRDGGAHVRLGGLGLRQDRAGGEERGEGEAGRDERAHETVPLADHRL